MAQKLNSKILSNKDEPISLDTSAFCRHHEKGFILAGSTDGELILGLY
jgi:hypothetical protein